MAKLKFFEQIKGSLIEREVEDVYNKGINLYFPDVAITHPFACDGFVDTTTENHKVLKLIIEYKLDEMLKSATGKAKVLVQVLYYMKRFEQNGLILPNVCMVGDIDECFVLHTNPLLPYLDEKIDWTIAPSEAHRYNPELVIKIANNDEINPFVFEIDENFSFKAVAEKIANLADNIQRYVRVTEHNIANIFDYFSRNAIKDAKKIAPNDLVAIFMGVISDKENYYQHPTKKNVLVTPVGKININARGFTSFFSYFDGTYTPQEKNKFAEISDRLIEDTKRRNTGEFYTPTLFVDYAHKMLTEKFGEDWKEKYVVWDSCCGTKNLTRDYRFAELYCSTLENAELSISERYNKEATAFQFDFLNDSLDKLPMGLKKAFEENKPIIFFINPPYATSSTFTANKQKEDGCCDNMVAEKMRNAGLDLACRNMIPQFLYRIMMIKEQYGLTDVHIALFTKPNFLCANSFTKFRKVFFDTFKYDNGIYFNASEFADVSDKWGIAFEIWNCGIQEERTNFIHKVVENKDGEITEKFKKGIYNCDGLIDTSKWVREIEVSETKVDMPIMKSAINQFENPKGKTIGQLTDDAIGCYYHIASDVYNSTTYVALFTANCSHPSGKWSITKNNFGRVMTTFASRKLVEDAWYNDKDIFLTPNTEHPSYKEFENDSIIYSLFHSASNQSSLRGVEYKGRKWDIKNEFFFMSKDDIAELANANYNDEVYEDCRRGNERYVYILLQNIILSPEAQAVLDKAKELVRKTFQCRNLFNEEHPEYQINNWDCGWYQIKALVKEYIPSELEEFKTLYKVLSNKMRPMVYELGFLK